jgi:hypothetical protein
VNTSAAPAWLACWEGIARCGHKDGLAEPPDPARLLHEVREFAELARAGAYMALIIDLACAMKDSGYFRSEDPVEAARFVVSEAVALLWETVRDRHDCAAFVQRAAPQLLRWESRYGWTHGWGRVPEKEASLASVLARMLAVPDAWTAVADCGNLAEWHGLLLERLAGSEAEDRLDRLASHQGLGGPDRTYLQAQLARQRGDIPAARTLIADCVRELTGEQDFARFAAEISAE